MSGFNVPYAGYLGLGPHVPAMFSHHAGSGDPIEQVACLADLGFAGVFDNSLVLRDAATQDAIGRAVARHGIAFGSAIVGLASWSEPKWNATDSDTRDELSAMLAAALDGAKRVGCERFTVITGVDRSRARAPQVQAFTDNLRWAADIVAAAGVTLCIEPTAGAVVAPGLLIKHMAEAAAIVAAIGHPAIGLNYDTGHVAAAGDDFQEALAIAGGKLGMVQLADGPDRVEVGAGPTDWTPLLRAIRATGYAGLYELEFEPIEPGLAGERALLDRLHAVDAAVGAGE